MKINKKNFDYKRLHPFKWFILENYPFLEDSIDVLTNYQLFCKLGEMYNKEINAINTLGIQVEGITDWFDNLDLQEEVNNKLDEMAESGELEEIISAYLNTKSILCFDTVSDMKSSENLIDGSYAQTLGYDTKNDGGKSTYKIRTITNDDVVDEMSIIALDNDDSLIAELIVSGNINVKQFGIDSTGESDISEKMESLISYCSDKNITNIDFENGTYLIENLIYVPYNISINGNDSLIKVKTNGYAFGLNTRDGINWVTAYPNYPKNTIKNFTIDNFDQTIYTTAKGFSICSGSIIKNIKFKHLYESISAPNKYIDNRTIENILIENKIGDSYDIKLYLGDGLIINNVCGASIYLDNVAGGEISSCIGSNYTFIDCRGLNVVGDHQEHDISNIIKSSQVSFNDCYYWKRTNPTFIIDNGTGLITSQVNLTNVLFNIIYNNKLSTVADDITTGTQTALYLNNVKECFAKDSGHASMSTTVRINGVDLSPLYSDTLIYKGGKCLNNVTSTSNLEDYNQIINVVVGADDTNSTYQNQTYYYKALLLLDPVRLIRPSSAHSYAYIEKSIAIGATKQKLAFILTSVGQIMRGYIRLYRGTTTDSYDSYVDIPLSGGSQDRISFDYGDSINGRYNWQSRTPGSLDLTRATDYFELLPNGNVKITSNGIPTAGTWKQGDIIINNNPTSGGVYSWVCVAGGTFGTWKELSTIG